VKPGSKIDCGWLGIDKETCLKRGCCWDDTNPNEYYCYVKEHSSKKLVDLKFFKGLLKRR